MSVMCLSDGSHWPATAAEYQKKKKKKKKPIYPKGATQYPLPKLCTPKGYASDRISV